MGSTVHRPGKVQAEYITEEALLDKGMVPGLVPEVDGNYGGQEEAKQDLQQNKILLMELHHRIGQNV